MFEVRNIAFTYCGRPVLRDVSFVVSPGEAVSVVGANGAGKTTLLKILATLAVPDSGLVLTDGRNALANADEYRRQLGYMPENVALYDDFAYDFNGSDGIVRVRVKVGNALGGYQETDKDGNPMYINVRVMPEIFADVDVASAFNERLVGDTLSPYDVPEFASTDTVEAILKDGGRVGVHVVAVTFEESDDPFSMYR